MATFTKFDVWTEDLTDGVHDFSNDTFAIILTNTQPSAGNTLLGNITPLGTGNGYNGSQDLVIGTNTNSSGSQQISFNDLLPWITATGNVGPFQYIVLYNRTTTAKNDPLIGYWSESGPISMVDQDTYETDFGSPSLTVA